MIKKIIILSAIFIMTVLPIKGMTLEIQMDTYDELTSKSAITVGRQVEIIDIVTNGNAYYLRFIPKNNILLEADENGETDNISYINFPESVFVQTGEKKFMKCKINWENIDNIDTSKEGRIVIHGDIIPPDGVEFVSGLPPVVEIPLLIYDMDVDTEYASVQGLYDDMFLVPYGCDLKDYFSENNTFLFRTECGDIFYCPVEWTDIPDTNTVGEIYMNGEFVLPEGIIPKNSESEYITQRFYVMKTDDIYMDYIDKTPSTIGCTWLKEIEDYENIIIDYSTDGYIWHSADKMAVVLQDCFYIPFNKFTSDTPYTFRLKYNNIIYGYLNVSVSESNIEGFYLKGDRDMGDNMETDMPDFASSQGRNSATERKQGTISKRKNTEITPENTSEKITGIMDGSAEEKNFETSFSEYQASDNSNKKTDGTKPEEVSEKNSGILTEYSDRECSDSVSVSETNEKITTEKTVLSGERLIEQAKTQGDTVTFEKKGVSLEIPSDFIKENNIEKDDWVAVSINPEGSKVNIDVRVNGNPVEKIEGSKIVVLDENNEPRTFDADKTGEYTIGNNTADKTDRKIIFHIITIIILMLIGGASLLIWRKRKL